MCYEITIFSNCYYCIFILLLWLLYRIYNNNNTIKKQNQKSDFIHDKYYKKSKNLVIELTKEMLDILEGRLVSHYKPKKEYRYKKIADDYIGYYIMLLIFLVINILKD